MNQVVQLKRQSGSDHINMWIDAVFECNIKDVLDIGYSVDQVEKYLTDKKLQMQQEILLFFRNIRKYNWRETGDDVEIDQTFMKDVLNFNGDVLKFKRYLKKASAQELIIFSEVLFKNENFIEK